MKPTVEQSVKNWFNGDLMDDECRDHPEIAWAAILKIAEHDLSDEEKSLLAAGPIENLLSEHGDKFIDRVEEEAKKNKKFNYLLGGVWKLSMPDSVWERVKSARKEEW